MADKNTRIAIVNHDKCKPKKCRQECKKSCPVVRMGKSRTVNSLDFGFCALLTCARVFSQVSCVLRSHLRVRSSGSQSLSASDVESVLRYLKDPIAALHRYTIA